VVACTGRKEATRYTAQGTAIPPRPRKCYPSDEAKPSPHQMALGIGHGIGHPEDSAHNGRLGIRQRGTPNFTAETYLRRRRLSIMAS
jgi:hypothetical protein